MDKAFPEDIADLLFEVEDKHCEYESDGVILRYLLVYFVLT